MSEKTKHSSIGHLVVLLSNKCNSLQVPWLQKQDSALDSKIYSMALVKYRSTMYGKIIRPARA